MTNIKLIALDMDGTLLNDDGVVTEYTKDIIQQTLRKNIHVVLSTGRPLIMCLDFVEQLTLPSYIITSNGAEIWTADNELIEQHTMDPSKIKSLWEMGKDLHVHMWLLASGEVFVDDMVPEDFTSYDWLKIGFGKLSNQEKSYILEQIKDDPAIEVSNSSRTNIEVTKKGVHKARAIQSICERLNIKMEEVMAIGDSLNDIKMIERAGIGVAVKNAQSKVIEKADYITATNNEDGVAKAIEKFVLNV